MDVYHEFLIKGEKFGLCKGRVLRFLEAYELVSYFRVTVLEEASCPATSRHFRARIERAVAENRRVLEAMLTELKGLGPHDVGDLARLPQGYPTKLLHTVTHVLDGFFGIDSFFYNLLEDSHWVSATCADEIAHSPGRYWLIAVSGTPAEEPQGFEKKRPSLPPP